MTTTTDFSPYAWIVDQDHLSGPGGEFYDPGDPDDNIGLVGPSNANVSDTAIPFYEIAKAELCANYQHRHQFRMYDDDGILYVTGTLFWNGYEWDPDSAGDEVCYAPLRDFGAGGLGCVLVKYTGRPEWDCG